KIYQMPSEQVKDEFFDAFFKSDTFEKIDHNMLLKVLANSKNGWNLYE
ncbi:2161_t:CDS:1, partial [Funneliformis mosseae]